MLRMSFCHIDKLDAEKQATISCALVCEFFINAVVLKVHDCDINRFHPVFYTLKSSCNPNLNSKYYKIL